MLRSVIYLEIIFSKEIRGHLFRGLRSDVRLIVTQSAERHS